MEVAYFTNTYKILQVFVEHMKLERELDASFQMRFWISVNFADAPGSVLVFFQGGHDWTIGPDTQGIQIV